MEVSNWEHGQVLNLSFKQVQIKIQQNINCKAGGKKAIVQHC